MLVYSLKFPAYTQKSRALFLKAVLFLKYTKSSVWVDFPSPFPLFFTPENGSSFPLRESGGDFIVGIDQPGIIQNLNS